MLRADGHEETTPRAGSRALTRARTRGQGGELVCLAEVLVERRTGEAAAAAQRDAEEAGQE
jgi:hypothetical protein